MLLNVEAESLILHPWNKEEIGKKKGEVLNGTT